jgi:hypothetical protein
MTFWLVVNVIEYCLVYASDREDAKRKAKPHLGADPDEYGVTPLIAKEDQLRAIVFGNILITNPSLY